MRPKNSTIITVFTRVCDPAGIGVDNRTKVECSLVREHSTLCSTSLFLNNNKNNNNNIRFVHPSNEFDLSLCRFLIYKLKYVTILNEVPIHYIYCQLITGVSN